MSTVRQLGLTKIDLLKIDVEGHEAEVLRGFQMLKSLAPKIIQFEYGPTFFPSRHTLQEVYNILGPIGYEIGRLYPRKVDFKAYAIPDENLRMGNYIAVKNDAEFLDFFK
jgi:hypothetical protein